ncbi:MAG: exodeoxyribonuclease III [Magnetococcales bacterium]|nr:exodeoxyribonuclease III [Magnetococcales bacterium]
MIIATWNVNSLRVRQEQVMNWLQTTPVDLLCMQETKVVDDLFPSEPFEQMDYQVRFSGQKSYNGVAIASRKRGQDVLKVLPGMEDDPQKRFMAMTVGGVRIVSIYVPNGSVPGSEKFHYKMRWLQALEQWLQEELMRFPDLVLVGDFNIAPEDRDVHDPERWQGSTLTVPEVRERFDGLLALPMEDALRRVHGEEGGHFSWWDYRAGAYRRGMGIRIDHVLVSTTMAERLEMCTIDREPRGWDRPSDHAPVVAHFATSSK